MIVSITGGTGFIGHKLVMKHLALGDSVRVLSRRSLSEAGIPDSVKLYHGDLSKSSDLFPFVDGADLLYHCAGEIRDDLRMHSIHVDGTVRLIHAAKGRIGRWVQLSSAGAYGRRREGNITELSELRACGTYEVSKVECENLVRKAASQGTFEYTILRPSNVYGLEMRNKSIFNLMAMIQQRIFFLIGKPGSIANYIHINDVVDALLLIGTSPHANGQIYNLSDHLLMEQFVSVIADSLGVPRPSIRLPELPIRIAAKLLEGIPKFPLTEARVDALTGRAIYISDKIKLQLNYNQNISIKEGLDELVKFYLVSTR